MNTRSATAQKFGRRYPWAIWFKRRAFSLRRGRDYLGMTHGMAQMVRNAASRYGLSVHVEIRPDGDTIRVAVKTTKKSRPVKDDGGGR